MFLFHGGTQTSTEFVENLNTVSKDDFLKFPKKFEVTIPQAELMSYTARKGKLKHIWFDRVRNTINEAENSIGMEDACQKLIDENPVLVEKQKLILGGYSMGGSLALYLGLRFLPMKYGYSPMKIFTMSSYLNRDSVVYENFRQNKTSIYMCHAKNDPIVPFSSGMETFQKLKETGSENIVFRTNQAYHYFDESQLTDVKRFCKY